MQLVRGKVQYPAALRLGRVAPIAVLITEFFQLEVEIVHV